MFFTLNGTFSQNIIIIIHKKITLLQILVISFPKLEENLKLKSLRHNTDSIFFSTFPKMKLNNEIFKTC